MRDGSLAAELEKRATELEAEAAIVASSFGGRFRSKKVKGLQREAGQLRAQAQWLRLQQQAQARYQRAEEERKIVAEEQRVQREAREQREQNRLAERASSLGLSIEEISSLEQTERIESAFRRAKSADRERGRGYGGMSR